MIARCGHSNVLGIAFFEIERSFIAPTVEM
jgi:hypothetical protein